VIPRAVPGPVGNVRRCRTLAGRVCHSDPQDRALGAVAELGGPADPASPRYSLNRPIGLRRALVVVDADLADVRSAAHAQGGTVK